MAWNFADMWESVSDALGDRVVLVQGDRRVTWSQFDDRAARLAAAFTAAGLGPGSKVASYLYNCNEYIEGVYATFKMRGVPVNVNYRYLEDELAYLSTTPTPRRCCSTARSASTSPRSARRPPNVKLVDPGRRRRTARRTSRSRYEELLAAHEPMPRIERSGDDLYFLYTGGTTGMPKGVMWRNEDLFKVLADSAYVLAGQRAARRTRRTRARSRPRSSTRASTACTCPRRRSCTAPARSRRSRRCSSAPAIVTLVEPRTSTRTSCGRPCSASASRRWRSSATRSPSRWCGRSRRPRRRARPTTSRRCSSSSARA